MESSLAIEFKHSLRGLDIFVQQTKDFRLALALYNDPIERDKLIVSLKEKLASASLEVIVLDLLTPSRQTTLLGRLEERLLQRQDTRQFVLMVTNLEGRVEYNPELDQGGRGTEFLATANLHRESFAKLCAAPVVLWMTELLERAFMRQAPDLWHWRSHVFDLRTRSKPERPTEMVEERSIRADDYRLHPETRLELLEEELVAYRKAASPADEMRVLNAIGNARLHMGDAKLARRDFEAVLHLARRLGNRSWEGAALGNLGNVYLNLGEARKAVEFFEQFLTIAHEVENQRGEGSALCGLGVAYAELGDIEKAITYHEQSFVLYRKIGDRHGEGTALGNLGNAYADLGDMQKAVEFFDQSLVLHREIGDQRGECKDLCNLGNAYAALGDKRKAIELYEKGFVLCHAIGDRNAESTLLGNLGNAYSSLGDKRKAVELYDQTLVLASEIGDRRGEGSALFNSAATLHTLGERSAAISRAKAALKIFENIEEPNASKVRATLAKWEIR